MFPSVAFHKEPKTYIWTLPVMLGLLLVYTAYIYFMQLMVGTLACSLLNLSLCAFSGCGDAAGGASSPGTCSADCVCVRVSRPPQFWPRRRTGAVHPRHRTGDVEPQRDANSHSTTTGAPTGQVIQTHLLFHYDSLCHVTFSLVMYLCVVHFRTVVECVLKHSTVTGDGSKTFILLLASLLRMIHTTACKEPNVSHAYNSREAAEAATARHLADELLAFALEELDDLIAMGVVPYGSCLSWEDFTAKTQLPAHTNNHHVQKLLASFFHSRLGRTHCDFISDLTCELLTHWKFKNDPASLSLQFVNDNFPALHTPVSGFPISCSRLIEGQVIHRDFATPCPQTDHQPVRAVVFAGCLQPKLLSAGEVLELGCGEQGKERSIMQFSTWAERSLECVIANLQSLGVSVLLSAVKQSAAVLALAAQADMCIVECVSEDELSLFGQLSGATPVSDCWMIEAEHVATLTFCRPILLGAHRYENTSLFLTHIQSHTYAYKELPVNYTYL